MGAPAGQIPGSPDVGQFSARPRSEGPARLRWMRVFREADIDGDDKITRGEFARSVGKVFDEVDTNGDGVIDGVEKMRHPMVFASQMPKAPGAPPGGPPSPGQAIERFFRRTDLDKDGKISLEEYLGSDERFEQRDENSDGFLTPDELAPTSVRQRMRDAQQKAAEEKEAKEKADAAE